MRRGMNSVIAILFFVLQVIRAQENVDSRASDSLVMEEHDANGNWAGGFAEGEEHKAKVSRRVSEMIDGIRRLEYSYDFDSTCVSSFRDCIDDSNCDSDEECFFSTSRRKRKLEASAAADEQRAAGSRGKNLRSLLFGTNNVGQCECI